MLKRFMITIVLTIFSQLTVKAQYETYMFINQMYMDLYQQQQKLNQQLMDAMNAEIKRMDANATASCVVLPYGNDLFYAHITLVYIGTNNVRIEVEDYYGDIDIIPSSSYMAVGQNIVTNSILKPGSTIYVRRNDSDKVLAKTSIPAKSSSNYQRFLANAYVLSQMYGNINNSSSTFESSINNQTKTQTTCSYCGGKGWVEGSRTPVYSSSSQRWCDDCHKLVNPSHSHDICPACMGKGYKP